MLVFDRCRRSSAAVTPFKYECNSKNPKVLFFKIKSVLNREIKEQNFNNPHPLDQKQNGGIRYVYSPHPSMVYHCLIFMKAHLRTAFQRSLPETYLWK